MRSVASQKDAIAVQKLWPCTTLLVINGTAIEPFLLASNDLETKQTLHS